jgi:hypothetical protein
MIYVTVDSKSIFCKLVSTLESMMSPVDTEVHGKCLRINKAKAQVQDIWIKTLRLCKISRPSPTQNSYARNYTPTPNVIAFGMARTSCFSCAIDDKLVKARIPVDEAEYFLTNFDWEAMNLHGEQEKETKALLS